MTKGRTFTHLKEIPNHLWCRCEFRRRFWCACSWPGRVSWTWASWPVRRHWRVEWRKSRSRGRCTRGGKSLGTRITILCGGVLEVDTHL